MTTIALSRYVIAADSAIGVGRELVSKNRKWAQPKIWRHGGRVFGLSGSLEALGLLKHWVGTVDIMNELCQPIPPDSDFPFGMLGAGLDGRLWYWGENHFPLEFFGFAAEGSGQTVALAAMTMGADPRYAVKVACMWDPGSNPPVEHLLLDPRWTETFYQVQVGDLWYKFSELTGQYVDISEDRFARCRVGR